MEGKKLLKYFKEKQLSILLPTLEKKNSHWLCLWSIIKSRKVIWKRSYQLSLQKKRSKWVLIHLIYLNKIQTTNSGLCQCLFHKMKKGPNLKKKARERSKKIPNPNILKLNLITRQPKLFLKLLFREKIFKPKPLMLRILSKHKPKSPRMTSKHKQIFLSIKKSLIMTNNSRMNQDRPKFVFQSPRSMKNNIKNLKMKLRGWHTYLIWHWQKNPQISTRKRKSWAG